LVVLVSAAIAGLFAFGASAQEATPTPTATPSPGIHAFEIYPKGGILGDFFAPTIVAGGTETLTVVLANTGDTPFMARTYPTNAHTAVNGGFSISDDVEEPTGVTLWLDYPEATYDIKPGTGLEREFSVTVPSDTPPGQYLTSLVLEDAEARSVDGTENFKQIVRFPVPVFITVPGELASSFVIDGAALDTSGSPFVLSIGISNTGNVKVRPAGRVAVLDSAGVEMFNTDVEMQSVFAHDQTVLVIGLPDSMEQGSYRVRADLTDALSTASDSAVLTILVDKTGTPVPESEVRIIAISGTARPDQENVQFLEIAVSIDNPGDVIINAQITLNVTHDGAFVESYALASGISIPNGTSSYQFRYIPFSGWTGGTWSLSLRIEAISSENGVAAVLAAADLPIITVRDK
jgi:hypothetical protein